MHQAILGLIDGVVRDHQRTRHGDHEVEVIPVVHDEFERDRKLLDAAFRRYDGELIVIDTDSPVRLPGSPAEELLTTVRTAAQALGVELDVQTLPDEFTVNENVAVNPAGRIVAAATAALMAVDLSASPLGFAYPTSTLDDLHKMFLWQLCVNVLPSYWSGEAATFVPIISGEIDVAEHCKPAPAGSIRFAVRDDLLIRRARKSTTMGPLISQLVPPSRPIVLFLGAGASASAEIPQGNSVRDVAIRHLLGLAGKVEAPDLAIKFREYLEEKGRFLSGEADLPAEDFVSKLTLERVLREEFAQLEGANKTKADSETVKYLTASCARAAQRTPEARKALRRILDAHPQAIVITVNFDQQVEGDLGANHRVYWRDDQFPGASEHIEKLLANQHGDLGVPILKIHGSIEDPESLVANLDQTLLGLSEGASAALDSILAEDTVDWLWVGCSMRDRDVAAWIKTKDGVQDVHEFWIDPLPGPGIAEFIETARRKTPEETIKVTARERVVSETADAFFAEFASRLEADD